MVTFPYHNKSIIAAVFLISLALLSGSVYASNQEASTSGTGPVCGNGVVESGEQCDAGGSNAACPAACSASCAINSCGGGGASGGGGYFAPSETKVIFSGRAYPGSRVTLLKDAQITAQTVADSAANFRISISGLSTGSYIFGVYSEDNQGRRSSLLTFPTSVTFGVAIEIGSIFITPTIAIDKSQVKHGENIAIFGQSTPEANITVSINSEEEFFGQIIADANGAYLYNFDTAKLVVGQHLTKSKAATGGVVSSFGKAVNFTVGAKTVLAQSPALPAKGDFNHDSRVNLIDFSITAYWYKRVNPPASIDLNGDGKVDLIDFSIMAFNWTG